MHLNLEQSPDPTIPQRNAREGHSSLRAFQSAHRSPRFACTHTQRGQSALSHSPRARAPNRATRGGEKGAVRGVARFFWHGTIATSRGESTSNAHVGPPSPAPSPKLQQTGAEPDNAHSASRVWHRCLGRREDAAPARPLVTARLSRRSPAPGGVVAPPVTGPWNHHKTRRGSARPNCKRQGQSVRQRKGGPRQGRSVRQRKGGPRQRKGGPRQGRSVMVSRVRAARWRARARVWVGQ